jgi:hypothetical protein
MGDGRWRNQYRRSGGAGGISSSDDSQSKLTSYKGFSHIDKSDVRDFLIPVVKEIGKCIYPPAAVPIEILYQMYKHADAIKEVGSAVMRGDYREAAKVVTKEIVKEVGGAAIGTAVEPAVAKASDSAAENVSSSLPMNTQGKEVGGKIAKGTVKGVVEATTDKVVDKVVDKVMDDERG